MRQASEYEIWKERDGKIQSSNCDVQLEENQQVWITHFPTDKQLTSEILVIRFYLHGSDFGFTQLATSLSFQKLQFQSFPLAWSPSFNHLPIIFSSHIFTKDSYILTLYFKVSTKTTYNGVYHLFRSNVHQIYFHCVFQILLVYEKVLWLHYSLEHQRVFGKHPKNIFWTFTWYFIAGDLFSVAEPTRQKKFLKKKSYKFKISQKYSKSYHLS